MDLSWLPLGDAFVNYFNYGTVAILFSCKLTRQLLHSLLLPVQQLDNFVCITRKGREEEEERKREHDGEGEIVYIQKLDDSRVMCVWDARLEGIGMKGLSNFLTRIRSFKDY